MNTSISEVREEYGLYHPVPEKLKPRADMVDYEEKKRTFDRPGGRMMIVAHRADRNDIFPENSLEGTDLVLSAGADIVETDIQKTADGVLIVMHDATLSRTTDAEKYIGKPGFPRSDEISDWTFAQIRALRLKFPSGKETPYLVPALSDQILVCKGRGFLTLDKHNTFDWDRDVYPLIEKTGAYETVMVPYTYSSGRADAIRRRMISDGGACSPFFADSRDDARIEKSEKELSLLGMPICLRGTEYRPEDDAEWGKRLKKISDRGGKYYIETLNPAHDNVDIWKRVADLGCGWLMGNRIYDQLKFVREYYPDYYNA